MNESNIKVDDLTVEDISDVPECIDVLKDLHRRSFYKRLHYSVYEEISRDSLASLRGLVTLHACVHSTIPPLSDLKELGFNVCSEYYDEDIKFKFIGVPNLCSNIERLCL